MANIIEKTFDVSKNIVRTIFLGKPNLFTTSDLNRQIEAFKYQMNSIENRLGAESDIEISFSSTGSRVSCSVTKGTYFRVNGLNIPLPNPSDVFGVDANYGTECYFYVWGNFARKTYTNDPTHEIAGAKFSDGTSMPAADQLVLGDVHYAITDDLGDITRGDNEFSFLIAKMNVLNISDKYIRLNYKKVGSSVMMDSITTLENVDPISDNLAVGDTFTNAIRKIRGAITNVKDKLSNGFLCSSSSEITALSLFYPQIANNHSYTVEGNAKKVRYTIHGGHLIIKVDTYAFPFEVESMVTNDFGPLTSGNYVYLGSIKESAITDALDTYRSKGFGDTIDLGIVGYTHDNKGPESDRGVWAPISLQVVYMGNVSGSATYSDWVILLRMKTGFRLVTLTEGLSIDTRSEWWPESSGPFVVEKTVSTFPIGIFIGESIQFIHI